MKHTATLVQQEFDLFKVCGQGLTDSPWVTALLEEKLSGKPLRAYFVSKIAERLQNEGSTLRRLRRTKPSWERLLYRQLPFVFEVVISIQYLHNQVLDGKSGVHTRSLISRNLLAANLLKEQLYHYINEELPAWTRSAVTQSVRNCFELVDQGQYLEQSLNTFQSFGKGNYQMERILPAAALDDTNFASISAFLDKLSSDLPPILHDQLRIYFQRIYLTCAALFVEASRLLGNLLDVKEAKMKPVIGFSLCYGLMRQLVNDNADWVPSSYNLVTHTKTATDAFSDLRNGTLTLPMIFFLAENKNSLLQQLLAKKMCWSTAFEPAIFEEMLASNALYKSIQNTRILAELALAYLPQDEMSSAYLAQSCEIVHWNKFLAPCLKHPAYQDYRKTVYYQRSRRLVQQLRKQRLQASKGENRATNASRSRARPTAVSRLEEQLRQEALLFREA